MKVLLILNNLELQNVRVMVRLTNKRTIRRVLSLLDKKKEKEVFDIVMDQGQVVDYLPYGKRIMERPDVTLFEDLL